VDLLVAHSCDPGYDCMPVLVLQCGRQELEDVVNYDRDSAFLDQDDIPVDWMPVIQPAKASHTFGGSTGNSSNAMVRSTCLSMPSTLTMLIVLLRC
jgi:hypothetical protein